MMMFHDVSSPKSSKDELSLWPQQRAQKASRHLVPETPGAVPLPRRNLAFLAPYSSEPKSYCTDAWNDP